MPLSSTSIELGAIPSIGIVGDPYHKAPAESVNGYYKYELIYGPTYPGSWRSIDDMELATPSWVRWHNHRRLHGHCGDIPPAEYEKTFYATEQGEQALVEIK